MKLYIVLNGGLKNKVIEKDVTEENFVTMINFINQHGLFEPDAWYPPTRIKEIKFDKLMGVRTPKVMWLPANIDDKKLEATKEFSSK